MSRKKYFILTAKQGKLFSKIVKNMFVEKDEVL